MTNWDGLNEEKYRICSVFENGFKLKRDNHEFLFTLNPKTKTWNEPEEKLPTYTKYIVRTEKIKILKHLNLLEQWIKASFDHYQEMEMEEIGGEKCIIFVIPAEKPIQLTVFFEHEEFKRIWLTEKGFMLGRYMGASYLLENFPEVKDIIDWIQKKSKFRLKLLF